ncbi:hypothetical protein KCP70_00700 [Salmonella enterica subsp. enterica]|nr:hypothetical protein KCP70_00700 [Salmonella enterica subsp. enterica]
MPLFIGLASLTCACRVMAHPVRASSEKSKIRLHKIAPDSSVSVTMLPRASLQLSMAGITTDSRPDCSAVTAGGLQSGNRKCVSVLH